MPRTGPNKDPRYEALLARLNDELAGSKTGAAPCFSAPLLIVAGLPRGGTTLLYQLLAASGAFVYPSNLIARFYRRPVLGWRVERLLEPLLPPRTVVFSSQAGRTETWSGPHELGYFWHAHLPFERDHQPSSALLAGWDHRPVAAELAALQAEDGRPLVVKNPLLTYVLGWLLDRIPEAQVVWSERPALATAASIYRTRRAEVGDTRRWWSVRPAGAQALEARSPEEQIASQIASLLRAREEARSRHSGRWLELEHARVCAEPVAELERVEAFLGVGPSKVSPPPGPFPVSGPDLAPEIVDRLRAALEDAGVAAGED